MMETFKPPQASDITFDKVSITFKDFIMYNDNFVEAFLKQGFTSYDDVEMRDSYEDFVCMRDSYFKKWLKIMKYAGLAKYEIEMAKLREYLRLKFTGCYSDAKSESDLQIEALLEFMINEYLNHYGFPITFRTL